MPKSTPLSEFEQGRALELFRRNFSQRQIAFEIGRSKTVVGNFLRNPDSF